MMGMTGIGPLAPGNLPSDRSQNQNSENRTGSQLRPLTRIGRPNRRNTQRSSDPNPPIPLGGNSGSRVNNTLSGILGDRRTSVSSPTAGRLPVNYMDSQWERVDHNFLGPSPNALENQFAKRETRFFSNGMNYVQFVENAPCVLFGELRNKSAMTDSELFEFITGNLKFRVAEHFTYTTRIIGYQRDTNQPFQKVKITIYSFLPWLVDSEYQNEAFEIAGRENHLRRFKQPVIYPSGRNLCYFRHVSTDSDPSTITDDDLTVPISDATIPLTSENILSRPGFEIGQPPHQSLQPAAAAAAAEAAAAAAEAAADMELEDIDGLAHQFLGSNPMGNLE